MLKYMLKYFSVFQGFLMKRSFHVMAKPAGALCNMACSYCFFLSKQQLLGSGAVMSDAILERFIGDYLQSQPDEVVTFSWQGGEPAVAGLDFYKKAVALQRRYAPSGVSVENDFQTNGLLLDDEWCRFLKDHRFLVGISLDGPASVHDRYRRDGAGRPTHARVMKTVELLHKYEIPFNTLTAVTGAAAAEPLAVYRFLRDSAGSRHIQFLPVVEPADFTGTAPAYWDPASLPAEDAVGSVPAAPGSFVTPWSVGSLQYGRFLCRIFDEWLPCDRGNIFVYLFECLLGLWAGGHSFLCTFGKECGSALALDRDGSVYFCDRFVYPDYFLGNIQERSLAEIYAGADNAVFGRMKSAVASRCKTCRWVFACRGECPKNRFVTTGGGEPGLNYLCSGLKMFFAHIDPAMKEMVRLLQNLK